MEIQFTVDVDVTNTVLYRNTEQYLYAGGLAEKRLLTFHCLLHCSESVCMMHSAIVLKQSVLLAVQLECSM